MGNYECEFCGSRGMKDCNCRKAKDEKIKIKLKSLIEMKGGKVNDGNGNGS